MSIEHKPVIETIVNTAAIALSSFGTIEVTVNRNYGGLLLIIFGMFLEYFKYYGRKQKLW